MTCVVSLRISRFLRDGRLGSSAQRSGAGGKHNWSALVFLMLVLSVVGLAIGAAILARKQVEVVRQRDRARKAVDEMYTEVAQKWLSQQPQLEQLQREFLLKALAFYQEFGRDGSPEPGARTATIEAERKAGEIHCKLGDHAEGEHAHRRAAELCELLVTEFPEMLEYRSELARCCDSLSAVLRETGRLADAERATRRALDLRGVLVAERPDSARYRVDLAGSQHMLGVELRERSQFAEAQRSISRAIELQDSLVAEYPSVSAYGDSLAEFHSNLGVLHFQTGNSAEAAREWHRAIELREAIATNFPDRARNPRSRQGLAHAYNNLGALVFVAPDRSKNAEQEFRRALELRESLAAEFPSVPEHRKDLAATYGNLGALLCRVPGRTAEAERALVRAIELSDELVAKWPNVPEYRSYLGAILNSLGQLQFGQGKLVAARSSYQRAAEQQQAALRANPGNPSYRDFLRNHFGGVAEVARKQGDHAGAAKAAEEFARVSSRRALDSVLAAEVLADCQKLAEADPHLDGVARTATVSDYARRISVALTDGADAAGNDPEALNGIAWFLATCRDSRFRNPRRAVELAQKAVACEPKAGAVWNTLGVAHYEAGAWDEAIAALSQSMELTSGGSAADWFFLAMAHWQMGDKDQAKKWYTHAIRRMEKNKPQDDEVRRFRDEAAALLGVTDHSTPTTNKEKDSKHTSKP